MATIFRALQCQRLVVLGEGGSGKTVAARMLTLDLLDDFLENPELAVPVPVRMASWLEVRDPDGWLSDRLAEDFPFLTRSAALELITAGRVMPVLDGFDEMPRALRPAAMKALNHTAGGRPLVLVSRTSEYRKAVTASSQELASAVVVELEPVGLDDASRFLNAVEPAATHWRPVLARLQGDPDAPLAQALTSPLAINLARTMYEEPETIPSELLDADRFPDREAVERHLLDALIPAVYGKQPKLSEEKQTRACDPTPDQARQWLAFLACHLDRRSTTNVAWWQLTHALPDGQAGALAGVLGSLTVGLTIVVALVMASAPFNRILFALTFGVVVGFAAGSATRPAMNSPSERPSRLALFGRSRKLGPAYWLGLLVGLVGALAFGVKGYDSGVVPAVLTGLAILFLAVILFVSLFGTEPIPDGELNSMAVLRLDRRTRLTVGLCALLIIGVPFWFWLNPALGLGGGLAAGIAYVSSGTYGRFSQARIWLACQRRLPLRLMTFLADAHDREVLRQVDDAYQFRHPRLKEQLVAQAGVN